MPALYIQHGKAGEPMSTERVQSQVTAIPANKAHRHGAMHEPTEYLVRHNGTWRRVWKRDNGSTYIMHAYTNLSILIRD